MMVIPETCRTF